MNAPPMYPAPPVTLSAAPPAEAERAGARTPRRTIAVWLPGWPVTAAALVAGRAEDALHLPMAVLAGSRVIATNDAARQQGVRRGQRRREAQYRCPSVLMLPRDPAAEVRAFEPVILALEAVTTGVEITRPGLAVLGARGPVRYYRGETAALAEIGRALAEVPAAVLGGVMLGLADGAFAAALAARTGTIVESGASSEFLTSWPISVFGSSEESPLVDVLLRLGVRTLGDLAGLPAGDVVARFGPEGAQAQRLASGHDDRPLAARQPPPDYEVRIPFEPPLDRADAVAFSIRSTAEEFIGGLSDRGLTCVCVEVVIELDSGEQLVRRWRHTVLLTSAALVDRIRWQLEGIFGPPAGSAAAASFRESGSVTAVTLIPVEVVSLGTQQLTLWGGAGERDDRAELGIARIQATYGHVSVTRLVHQGGTGPADRTGRVPWGEPADPTAPADQPWPARLPSPMPTVLFDPPRPVEVLDERGCPVVVSERGVVPRPPVALSVDGHRNRPIIDWAGPWPDTEAFWNPDALPRERRLRCQLVDVHGRAYLAVCRAGSEPEWLLEGVYD